MCVLSPEPLFEVPHPALLTLSSQALNSPCPSPGLRLEYPCLKWAGVLSSGAAFHWLGLDWGRGLSAPVQGLRRESSFLYPLSPPWTRRSDLPPGGSGSYIVRDTHILPPRPHHTGIHKNPDSRVEGFHARSSCPPTPQAALELPLLLKVPVPHPQVWCTALHSHYLGQSHTW